MRGHVVLTTTERPAGTADRALARRYTAIAMLCPVACAAVLLALTLGFAGRGVDLGDESYLLSIIRDPSSTMAIGEPFLIGPLLHPLFGVLGDDVATFRILGMVALFASVAVLSDTALRVTAQHGMPAMRWTARLAVVIPIVGIATTAFAFTPRIPGYRVLALLGLAVVSLGLLRAQKSPMVGGAVAGLGTVLTAVGKPSSGVALMVAVPAAGWLMRVLSRRMVIAWVAAGAVSAGLVLAVCGMTPVEAFRYVAGGLGWSGRQVRTLPWLACLASRPSPSRGWSSVYRC